jgi:site-specific DNA recombinase
MKNMDTYKADKYFLYIRRSQDAEDRQMASLDDQEKEMREVAKRLNLKIADVIHESQSAKQPGRPKFNEMIARIHSGEADGILCWKINRLARNPVDGGQISWLLQQRVISHIQTYTRDYQPSDNVIMMAVELGMANQFVNDLSVDVKRGMRNKAERGWNPQRLLPIGYKHNKGYEKGEDEIMTNDDILIVERLFREMLTGSYSASDIHRLSITYGLLSKKGKPRTLQTIVNMLTSEFYFGQFAWKDQEGNQVKHAGVHATILTEVEYNRVQQLLGKKGRPTRVNKLDFAFRGPVKCGECSCSVTAEHKTRCICSNCKFKFSCKVQTECPKCNTDISEMENPKLYNNVYYHCTKKNKEVKCSQSVIDETDLEKQILTELGKIEISDDFYRWAVEALKYMHGDEMVTQDEVAEKLDKKASGLRNRLDQLVVMRADGEITGQQLSKMSEESNSELRDLEGEQKRLYNRMSEWVVSADKYLTFAEKACERFNISSNQEKREMLETLGSTLELIDKKLRVVVPNELLGFSNVYKKMGNDLGRFDTKKALDIQGLSGQKREAFTNLCAEQDSNLRRINSGSLQPPAIDHSAIDA